MQQLLEIAGHPREMSSGVKSCLPLAITMAGAGEEKEQEGKSRR